MSRFGFIDTRLIRVTPLSRWMPVVATMRSGRRVSTISAAGSRESNSDADAKHGTGKGQDSTKNIGGRPDRLRVRPAYMRSTEVEDTPLRDANREFILGVLTARAARTLVVYLQETNLTVSQWLVGYMSRNPITLSGTWEDISGDTFLRHLLSMPVQEAKWNNGVDAMHDNFSPIGVDPRSIAQRILEIRANLAKEVIQDLSMVPEDNNELLRQSLRASLERSMKLAGAVDIIP